MEEKKKKNPFIRIIMILFFIYIAYYIAIESGYYQSSIRKKTIITKEKMEEFENDVREGKSLDLENYINIDSNNYENGFSKIGKNFSETIEGIMNNTIKYTVDILSSLFS